MASSSLHSYVSTVRTNEIKMVFKGGCNKITVHGGGGTDRTERNQPKTQDAVEGMKSHDRDEGSQET